MSLCEAHQFVVVTHCNLSGWVETESLPLLSFQADTDFFEEDVICRHGGFRKLIIDGVSENKDAIANLAWRYGVKRVVVSAYYPQANGIIEHRHKPIVDAFSKVSNGKTTNWVKNLPAVLWTDQSAVCISTDLTPYYIYCKSELIHLIELEIPTWQI